MQLKSTAATYFQAPIPGSSGGKARVVKGEKAKGEKEKGVKGEDLVEGPLKPPGEEDQTDENMEVQNIFFCLIILIHIYIILINLIHIFFYFIFLRQLK